MLGLAEVLLLLLLIWFVIYTFAKLKLKTTIKYFYSGLLHFLCAWSFSYLHVPIQTKFIILRPIKKLPQDLMSIRLFQRCMQGAVLKLKLGSMNLFIPPIGLNFKTARLSCLSLYAGNDILGVLSFFSSSSPSFFSSFSSFLLN